MTQHGQNSTDSHVRKRSTHAQLQTHLQRLCAPIRRGPPGARGPASPRLWLAALPSNMPSLPADAANACSFWGECTNRPVASSDMRVMAEISVSRPAEGVRECVCACACVCMRVRACVRLHYVRSCMQAVS